MNRIKILLLPAMGFAILGACAPYPPYPNDPNAHQGINNPNRVPQLTPEQQQQKLEAERKRLAAKERERERARERNRNKPSSTTQSKPKPPKPRYPTASPVPGKKGFVFNPYTHNIVDVSHVGSGKLVRDPEDSDPSHKFRTP